MEKINQEIINLFDEYTHLPLSREDFLSKLAKLTGSVAAAAAVLPFLEKSNQHQSLISQSDDALIIEEISYKVGAVSMKGYLAKPKSKKKLGSVIVIHENRGLNEHIKDITRRLAKAGYLSLGVDGLSSQGGTPANEDEARGLFGKLNNDQTVAEFVGAIAYLKSRKDSNGKVGCIGFCWGGAMANNMAVNAPDLLAAVPYYGRQPDADKVKNIKAKMLMQYGGLDTRVNEGIPAYETALKAANIKYEIFVYEGAQHAFNNDTSTARYNKEVANLAWGRTLALFKETLN